MSEHEDCVNCGITEHTNRLMKKRIAELEQRIAKAIETLGASDD